MTPAKISLRAKLTVALSVAMMLPLVVLLGVTATVLDVEQTVSAGGSEGGSVTTDVVEGPAVGAITWTALGLTPIVVLAAWVLAGRSVAPLRRIAEQIGDIDNRLDSRLSSGALPPEAAGIASSVNGLMDRLQVAADRQDVFVREVGHELRTPLAVLSTALDVAIDDPDESADRLRSALLEQRDLLSATASNVSATLEALESGGWSVRHGHTDLAAMCHDVAAYWSTALQRAGVEIVVEAVGPIPATVDPTAIRRAVDILVDNARVHAVAATQVVVGARTGTDPDWVGTAAGEHVEVWVGDDGGVPPPQVAGGLGLRIAREIAVGHGGGLDIRLASRDGEGTLATLTLPRVKE